MSFLLLLQNGIRIQGLIHPPVAAVHVKVIIAGYSRYPIQK